MSNYIVQPPHQPFTLPNLFKGVFNGEIYVGLVDSTDPKNNQVQAYIENEDLSLDPIPQPLKANGGGYIVDMSGNPARVVVKSSFSMQVLDKAGNQVWYEPNMSFFDPQSAIAQIGMTWTPGSEANPNQIYIYTPENGLPIYVHATQPGLVMGPEPLPSQGFSPIGNGKFFTWSDFNVKTDGTDQLIEVQAAINLCADMGLKISDVNPVSVSGTLVFPDNLVFDEMHIVAVGNGWTHPANVPNANTDEVGSPLVHATGDNIKYRYLGLDGGLTTINTDSQDVAASGICWNSTSEAEALTGTTHVHHYNRYGFWVRGKHTDSKHENILTNQWVWGEKGWTDNSARTALGFVNSSGDFSVSSIMSWYNLSNIKHGSTCFTTHYAFIHPYNGSQTPSANRNIDVVNGATNQMIDTCYLDNGFIACYSTANLNIQNLNVVKTSASTTTVAIRYTAEAAQINLAESYVGNAVISTNELYTTTGEFDSINKPRIVSVRRRGTQTDPLIASPHESHTINQTYDGRHYYRINSDGLSPEVDRTNGMFSVRDSQSGALFSGVTVAGTGRTAIGGNPTSDMSALPTTGTTVCEHGMFGSNGVDFGTAANPNNPSVRLQLIAAENWNRANSRFGTQFAVRTTTVGGATDTISLVVDSRAINPGTDGTISAGKSDKRYSQVWVVNGAINTSDETKKYFDSAYDDTFFEGMPNAVLDAWGEIPIVRFKWLDEIEKYESGERDTTPRWHIGRKAQDVQRAFARHGVDAGEYGVFCYDKWEETVINHPAEYGEGELVIREAWTEVLPAGEIYSIRDNEAANIEAAYQRRRMARIEAKLGM